MPEISIGMSVSSSTIRMSCAMDDRPRLGLGAFRHRFPDPSAEHQADARATAGPVLEAQLARVILHDLLDDRQTQPRTLAAGRHVGLGQAIATIHRQSPAA